MITIDVNLFLYVKVVVFKFKNIYYRNGYKECGVFKFKNIYYKNEYKELSKTD